MFNATLKTAAFALLASAAMATSACSTTKDFGDQMEEVSKNWKRSEAKVERGEDMVKDGNRLIRKGNDQMTKGATEERKAIRALADTRMTYDVALASIGTATDPDAAEAEAKDIRKLEKRVKSTEKDLADSKDKQKRGKNNVEDGKSKVKKGQRLIAEGEAERKTLETEYNNLASSVQ